MNEQVLTAKETITGNMFCFQCQEAAKGTGCEIKGICGKDDKVSNLQDLLIYVS
jgi:hydroxylamine reductase